MRNPTVSAASERLMFGFSVFRFSSLFEYIYKFFVYLIVAFASEIAVVVVIA